MRTCNRENMQQLVDALESDEFEQTAGVLRHDDKFCCLGVACQISGVGAWELLTTGYAYRALNDWSISVLPMEMVEWLGLKNNDSANALPVDSKYMDDNGDYMESAMCMNDNGSTFAEIAKALRDTYLED